MMENVLEICGIKKSFRDAKTQTSHIVLDQIQLTIKEGKCLGIVGRSGCGKSTLARVIARMIPADDGRILLMGRDITKAYGKDLREVYRKMQMIFQQPEESFDPRRTLGWSIGEALRNQGKTRQQAEQTAGELMEELGLPKEYVRRYPHEVSGGECQRAAIARALIVSPKLLICDEVTSALDVTVQAQVIELLGKQCRKKDIACLFITHDLMLLSGFADRIAVMQEGRITECEATERILRDPQSAAARELLAADFFRL